MPDADPVNWQPISQIPLIASIIDGALDDTRDHVGTLSEARSRPHVLDDATIDGVDRVHNEQLEYVDVYDQQISRWRTEMPSAAQTRELDRMEEQNRHLRAATMEVLALAGELRKGSIDRIMEMSDLELGLKALLGGRSAGRR